MTNITLFHYLARRVEPIDHILAQQMLAVCTLPGIADRLATMTAQLNGMIDADALDKCDLRGLVVELAQASEDVREAAGMAASDRRMARQLSGGGL